MREITYPIHTTKRVRGVPFFLPLLFAILFVSKYAALPAIAAEPAPDPAAAEIKLGTDEDKQFCADPKTKFVKDPALTARIEEIGNAVAEVANRKKVPAGYGKPDVYKFHYTFKIVDDKDINAFSLPGGFIYINKGLIDYAQSDDEIAGVIGHEMGHIAHHHSLQLIATQNKQSLALVGMMLAGALAHVKGDGLMGMYEIGNLLSIARLNGYGQQAEFDADKTGISFLTETKYNPVGILTFMQRLALEEARKPEVEYGIYATHPPSQVRAERMIDEIGKLGLSINRRLVTNYMKVQVKPVDKSSASSVWISNTEIIRLADSGGKKSPARAEMVAALLRDKLLAGAQYHDVKLDTDTNSVSVMGEDIFTPKPEDAALAGITVEQLARKATNNIQGALMNEILQEGL